MSRTLILHIGTEKTGSTSIQNVLHGNRALLSQHGYHYLMCAGHANHVGFPAYCSSTKKLSAEVFKRAADKFISNFDDEMQSLPPSIHTVIVSSEFFHSATTSVDDIKKIKDLVSPYFSETKVICYVREQVAMCESLYSTAIKNGRFTPFEEFILTCNPSNIFFNHCNMLSNWSAVFSQGDLVVRLFDKNAFYENDLIEDFLYYAAPLVLGKLVNNATTSNVSLTPYGQLLGRLVNRMFNKSGGSDLTGKNRIAIMNWIYQHHQGKSQQILQHDAERIFKLFEESNKELSVVFFNSEANVFHLKERPSSYELSINAEQEAQLEALISKIMSATS